MAGAFSLSDGVDTVTLGALSSTSPNMNVDLGEVRNISLNGNLRIHSMYSKVAHDLVVNNVSSADATLLNGWKADVQALTYTPDTDSPGTTYSVYITGDGLPMQWMPGTLAATKFQGTIMIREL